MVRITLTLSVFLCLTAACQKKSRLTSLPPVSSTGANTFGCLVDGKFFLPGPNVFAVPVIFGLNVNYDENTRSISLSATATKSNPRTSITFNINGKSIESGDQLPIGDASTENSARAFYLDGMVNDYITSASSPGILTINNFDTEARIFSGTFSFDAFSRTGNKVSVTNGRFDVKF